MLFLFQLQVCGLTLSIADLGNSFCQSNSLDRSASPLHVGPCEGVDLPPGSLIQLVAPVYGFNDATLRWHRTLMAWLIKQRRQLEDNEETVHLNETMGQP